MKTTKVVVALYLSKLKDQDVATRAVAIASSVKENKKFTDAGLLAQADRVLGLANDLRQAIDLPYSSGKADVLQRTRIVLDMALSGLANMVETLANNNEDLLHEDRLEMIHNAGLQVKPYNGRGKRTFSVEQGNQPGSATCYAAADNAMAHEWQMAEDVSNLGVRVTLPATTRSTTVVTDLKPGNEYAFYHRPVKSGQPQAWEGPIFFRVV